MKYVFSCNHLAQSQRRDRRTRMVLFGEGFSIGNVAGTGAIAF
ncbi:hypothetical protein [[Limnothrix rosea] IAM M-220]|nr:hypothetical protein [[Limnothrix rosea] IAM M-220]